MKKYELQEKLPDGPQIAPRHYFHRSQDKLTKNQFIYRRHYNITDKVYDFAKMAQFEAYKKDRNNVPTLADIYYQLIIEGLKYADKVTFRTLPKNHKSVIKIGNPIITKLFEVQSGSKDPANQRKGKFGPKHQYDIFSVAVCLMEAAIDNQTK